MTNFKEETQRILEEYNKTFNDIKFIQGEVFSISNSIEEIVKLMDFEYDSGYGSPKIAQDLVIVGDDWWLERHEYDGSEWWEYKELPKQLERKERISRFQVAEWQVGWENLEKCNIEQE